MCLAKVYLNKWGDEPVLRDITHMQLHGEWVELKTLLGKVKVIPRRVVEVDFTAYSILLDDHHEPEELSQWRMDVIK